MRFFTIEELSRSETARRLRIDNTPDAPAVDALRVLVDKVLDPIRAEWGCPIRVNSGYRCQSLNAVVGGTRYSHHTLGMAADITAGSRDANGRLFQMIRGMRLQFTQLIWEKGDDSGPDWIHISYNPRDLRCAIKRIR